MFEERITLSLNAMATRFEIVLHGSDRSRLRAAAEEALEEVQRIECQLSIYRADSELYRLNSRAADGPVKVDSRLFRLLERAQKLSRETDGAFDMTITPLLRVWGFMGDQGEVASEDRIAAARENVGMQHVVLDEDPLEVRFDRPGTELDPGAIGKGYAVERAAGILKDIGITSALIHGGTSTVCAIGAPPERSGWPIAIRSPLSDDEFVSVVKLCDSSLSVSAIHGKSFTNENREFGHVIDPRSGMPTQAALSAAVIGSSPTDCDALSTALLVLGEPWLHELARTRPDYRGLVAVWDRTGKGIRVAHTARLGF